MCLFFVLSLNKLQLLTSKSNTIKNDALKLKKQDVIKEDYNFAFPDVVKRLNKALNLIAIILRLHLQLIPSSGLLLKVKSVGGLTPERLHKLSITDDLISDRLNNDFLCTNNQNKSKNTLFK